MKVKRLKNLEPSPDATEVMQQMNAIDRRPMDDIILRRLAKFIVRHCFRDNTNLEYLHASPQDRISQAEMRELMMASVNNCYTVLSLLFGDKPLTIEARHMQAYLMLITRSPDLVEALRRHDFNPEWAEPGTKVKEARPPKKK